MKRPTVVTLSLLVLATALTAAHAQSPRETAVLSDRQRVEADTSWIYNDLDRGFAAARDTGKPLLVLIRCLP